MRHAILISAFLAVCSAPTAHAEGLPTPAPAAVPAPAVEAAPSAWCYAGMGAGKNITTVAADDGVDGRIDINLDGYQVGLRAGCDVQIPSTPIVLGAWGGYDFVKASANVFETKVSTDDYWSLGGRAGFKLNSATLVYALAGFAKGDLTIDGESVGTKSGIVYGAGLEIDMSNLGLPMIGFVEWDRLDWKAKEYDGGKISPATDIVMVGARIKFNVLK